MIFTEARFILFFVVVLAVYWALPGNVPRKRWLLLASATFYGAWDWRFLGLMYGSTVLDYFMAILIAGARSQRARQLLLLVSVVANLGILGLFKYFDFFTASAMEFGHWLGFDMHLPTLRLILPVGISFYTFQSLSYTIDVYRGHLKVVRNFADFSLFVSFFPQLVAGPIVRAADFLPQLERKRVWEDVRVRACLTLFLIGYFKKACVSDNVAPIVDLVYADPGAYATAELWLGALLYTIQVYCDFSGYTDMAIATAGLLGYHLPLNFDFPYLSRSITEFWRRWHISLSSWFRDYVYIPLGGSRKGRVRTYLNLWVMFPLIGLWHGAAWTYVLFGILHGAIMMLERMGSRSRLRLPHTVAALYVVFTFSFTLVVFRSQSLGDAWRFLGGAFGGSAGGAASISPAWWAVIPVFAAGHLMAFRRTLNDWWSQRPAWQFSLAYGALVAFTLPWVAADYRPFMYFQF